MTHNIAVIGAGVMGLASAVRILENIPRVTVTVMADKFSPNTTSDGAAGLWEPYAPGNTPEHLQQRWGDATFHHLEALLKTEESSEAGVTTVPSFHISNQPIQEPHYSKTVYNYRQVSTNEISKIFPQAKHGIFFITILCECRMYLPWLLKRFKKQGGRAIKRHISDLGELAGQYDVIVNCAGLHARSLVNDESVHPIRGQVIRVKAPWIRHFVDDYTSGCYIIPCANNVVLGGTLQKGSWNTQPDAEDKKRIFEDCCSVYPSLKHAEVDYDWVGLRPGRSSVRLEKEITQVSGREMKIVHNYGHGGSGITFHWGCAQDTTAFVAELLGEEVNFQEQPASKL
ncbi:D-aspartate oxidase-like [Ptychodera flava]|uniref:D-aspartate oxidase-like n=1 Tax=Ptychodera flava TaxID=63121 RepID=UPI00396A077A